MSLIGATRTKTRLRVKAMLDRREYGVGLKIADEDMERLNLRTHPVHLSEWNNYTIGSRRDRK